MAYSDKVIDHMENPRNVGSLDKADPQVGTGMVGAPACGDVMKLQLKITDDGIELIAENLRKLRSLDLSWCPRVTDAALEYIACDLNHLEELTLDR